MNAAQEIDKIRKEIRTKEFESEDLLSKIQSKLNQLELTLDQNFLPSLSSFSSSSSSSSPNEMFSRNTRKEKSILVEIDSLESNLSDTIDQLDQMQQQLRDFVLFQSASSSAQPIYSKIPPSSSDDQEQLILLRQSQLHNEYRTELKKLKKKHSNLSARSELLNSAAAGSNNNKTNYGSPSIGFGGNADFTGSDGGAPELTDRLLSERTHLINSERLTEEIISKAISVQQSLEGQASDHKNIKKKVKNMYDLLGNSGAGRILNKVLLFQYRNLIVISIVIVVCIIVSLWLAGIL